jgi:hypothetical protein
MESSNHRQWNRRTTGNGIAEPQVIESSNPTMDTGAGYLGSRAGDYGGHSTELGAMGRSIGYPVEGNPRWWYHRPSGLLHPEDVIVD